MPQLLKNRDNCPPDFYRNTDRDTGHKIEARTYYDWIANARQHRVANSLPIPDDFEAQLNSELCAQLPPEWCEGSDPNRPWVDIRFSLGDVGAAMRVFANFALSGFNFVSQDEATRRARLCVGCYNNINVQGCGACQQLGKVITGTLAQRKTPHDDALKVCGVCRCLNRAQVHIPLENLAAKDSPDKQALYPAFCWLRRDGENYLPAAA